MATSRTPPKRRTSEKITKKEPDKQINYCRVCQRTLTIEYFYEAHNKIIDTCGFMSICRDCCEAIYNTYYRNFNDVYTAIYYTCEDLDYRCESVAVGKLAKKLEARPTKAVYAIYRTFLSTIDISELRFKFSTFTKEKLDECLLDASQRAQLSEPKQVELDAYELTKTPEIVAYVNKLRERWGSDFSEIELHKLQSFYEAWEESHEIKGKSMEITVEQLCYEELAIWNARQLRADATPHIKNLKMLQENGNLSPRQRTDADKSEYNTFGGFLKDVELNRPIVHVDPELSDIDDMDRKCKAIVGGIARTLGKTNEFTAAFDDYFVNHTVDYVKLGGGKNV